MPRQDPGEPYYRVDSPEANSILNAEPDTTVVIDVRRDDEWVTGHVSGAIHIPVDDLSDRMDQVPQDKKLLFICAAGVRSGLACEMAASMPDLPALTPPATTPAAPAPQHDRCGQSLRMVGILGVLVASLRVTGPGTCWQCLDMDRA